MTCVAIIPARGGSRRIPGKNTRDFRGRPIIEYSILAAKETGIFTRIIVSTDDSFAASCAYRMGADVMWRPDSLAKDSVGTQEVAAHVLKEAKGHFGIPPPLYACCIYATAPLMHFTDLLSGYLRLRILESPYVYSVGPDWQDAGQWYWGLVQAFTKGVSLDLGDKQVLPSYRVCDINTKEDWQRAEQMYDQLHEDDK